MPAHEMSAQTMPAVEAAGAELGGEPPVAPTRRVRRRMRPRRPRVATCRRAELPTRLRRACARTSRLAAPDGGGRRVDGDRGAAGAVRWRSEAARLHRARGSAGRGRPARHAAPLPGRRRDPAGAVTEACGARALLGLLGDARRRGRRATMGSRRGRGDTTTSRCRMKTRRCRRRRSSPAKAWLGRRPDRPARPRAAASRDRRLSHACPDGRRFTR